MTRTYHALWLVFTLNIAIGKNVYDASIQHRKNIDAAVVVDTSVDTVTSVVHSFFIETLALSDPNGYVFENWSIDIETGACNVQNSQRQNSTFAVNKHIKSLCRILKTASKCRSQHDKLKDVIVILRKSYNIGSCNISQLLEQNKWYLTVFWMRPFQKTFKQKIPHMDVLNVGLETSPKPGWIPKEALIVSLLDQSNKYGRSLGIFYARMAGREDLLPTTTTFPSTSQVMLDHDSIYVLPTDAPDTETQRDHKLAFSTGETMATTPIMTANLVTSTLKLTTDTTTTYLDKTTMNLTSDIATTHSNKVTTKPTINTEVVMTPNSTFDIVETNSFTSRVITSTDLSITELIPIQSVEVMKNEPMLPEPKIEFKFVDSDATVTQENSVHAASSVKPALYLTRSKITKITDKTTSNSTVKSGFEKAVDTVLTFEHNFDKNAAICVWIIIILVFVFFICLIVYLTCIKRRKSRHGHYEVLSAEKNQKNKKDLKRTEDVIPTNSEQTTLVYAPDPLPPKADRTRVINQEQEKKPIVPAESSRVSTMPEAISVSAINEPMSINTYHDNDITSLPPSTPSTLHTPINKNQRFNQGGNLFSAPLEIHPCEEDVVSESNEN